MDSDEEDRVYLDPERSWEEFLDALDADRVAWLEEMDELIERVRENA